MKYLPKRNPIHRRTFLRGTLGAAVALPLLESMLDVSGNAYAAEAGGEGPPTRYVMTFAGSSIGSAGEEGNDFVPSRTGAIADQLPRALEPLGDWGVAEDVSVVSGLAIPWAEREGQTPPPGGRIVQFHGGAQGPLLTGVRSQGDQGWKWIAGDSSDQVVARALGVKPLVLRVQAGTYISGSSPSHSRKSISYRDGGATAVNPLVNPHQVFDRLFGSSSGFQPPEADQQTRDARRRQLTSRRSVLDAVRSSYERLKRHHSLGAGDKRRIEQHFDEIRDMERRLEQLAQEQQVVADACQMPASPGEEWPVAGGHSADGMDRSANFTSSLAWSHEDLRAEALTDMLYYALVCDLTRVGALQYTMRQSFMSAEYMTRRQVRKDIHAVGHSWGDRPDVSDIHAWHINYFGKLVKKLADAREADGSRVLDHCALMYVPEAGHGFNPESGGRFSTHSTDNMAMLVAGGAGGLAPGRHIIAPDSANHPANVYISAMRAVGAPNNGRLGEISGVIPEMFGG